MCDWRGARPFALLLVLAASLFRDFRQTVVGRLAIALASDQQRIEGISAIGATLPISAWHAR